MSDIDLAKEFLLFIIKNIVSNPTLIVLEGTEDDLGVFMNLKVAPEDMPRIIGKNGQTAQSLRTLLRVFGSKRNKRMSLKILEPVGSETMAASEEPLLSDE